tara:strand:+ start:6710 stop:8023 length:1314 start_codon:yes stop_codon:yes gene_type:complete
MAMKTAMMALAGLAAACAGGPESPNPGWDSGWAERESWCLTDFVQLTSETEFLKAGESYFSPDGNLIIFQGTPRPEGDGAPDRHYGMYVAPVARDQSGAITGLGTPTLLSEPGSSNTCGWFHPTQFTPRTEYTVLFGTTTTPPNEEAASGYQRGTSRYTWQFPNEMEIVACTVGIDTIGGSGFGSYYFGGVQTVNGVIARSVSDNTPLWTRDGYDAEASWSPDGRHVLYTRLKPGSDDGDLWIYDTTDGTHTELIAEEGYDGGPFFSPDGTRICYRSDRRGDKALQLYVSELAFDESGKVTGIAREIPITDNEHVNWAPFFTPDGSALFYATSEVSHGNYEVFAIDATGDHDPADRARVRITDARGFDGLPVFTPDGAWMMWTAQRGEQVAGEDRPSSQLWAARIDLDAVEARLEAERRKIADRKLEEGFQEFMPGG